MGMEEDQGHAAGLVPDIDLVGQAGVARFDMPLNPHGDRRHRTGPRLGDCRGIAAVDDPRRQVPQQIDDPFAGQAFDVLGDPRPDPRQAT